MSDREWHSGVLAPGFWSAARRRMAFAAALVALVAVANILVWAAAHQGGWAPDVRSPLKGVGYSPFGRDEAPWVRQSYATTALQADLRQLAGITGHIRTYSASQYPELPALAAQQGLRVALGLALGKDGGQNAREIRFALDAARQHANVTGLVVGNETILKRNLTPAALVAALGQVRARSNVPVTTAEPWHVWLKHPELADAVDFITIHLLTYWEGVGADTAVDETMARLQKVRARFPGRKIVIGEVGYPSRGGDHLQAKPSPAAQAGFVRRFVERAEQEQLDYFLIEAYDQPWKVHEEGRAGGYWGLFDAARQPKYALVGPVQTDSYWPGKAIASSLLASLLLLVFFGRVRTLQPVASVAFAVAVQGLVSLATVAATLPLRHYFSGSEWLGLAALLLTCGVTSAILVAHLFEFAEVFWPGSLKRQFAPCQLPPDAAPPFVSIHMACRNENPDMVIASLKSLQALRYPAFEVIVVDNNTPHEETWRPVQATMAILGPNFRFFQLPTWPGFKAGALNFALAQTSPQAEWVGVVDADYEVHPDWLAQLVGHFQNAQVGVVQAPQAHRDWQASAFRRAMNWEYDGFFRIGMHHRNERDAIIQHGTMTLVRASALRNHGQWAEWCLCEDAELGLRLMQAGWTTVYVDAVLGTGLTPDGFGAFKKQRQRWAHGGMQILKHHWAALVSGAVPPATGLSRGQQYHFLAGWLPWLGDFLHLVFVLMAVAWTWAVLALPHRFSLPFALFMMPLAMFCATKLLIGPVLYGRRVPCSAQEVWGAALAGMALSHAVARGVMAGLFQADGVFNVTAKGGAAGPVAAPATLESTPPAPLRRLSVGAWGQTWSPVREELLLLCALCTAAIAVYLSDWPSPFEATLWMGMLMLQALPYAAAVTCAWVSAREA